jgi:hypothetical protein
MAKIKIEWSSEARLDLFDQLILIMMVWDCRRNPEDKIIGQRIK